MKKFRFIEFDRENVVGSNITEIESDLDQKELFLELIKEEVYRGISDDEWEEERLGIGDEMIVRVGRVGYDDEFVSFLLIETV